MEKSRSSYEVLCTNSLPEVEQAIKDHEIATCTRFCSYKKEKLFGKETEIDISKLRCDIRFNDAQANTQPYIPGDGVPFIIIGKKLLQCHQGKDRNKKKKEKYKQLKDTQSKNDHAFVKRKRRIQGSKKKDCDAKIRLRHIIKFPDYKINVDASRHEKDITSSVLKSAMKNNKKIVSEHHYYIMFPNHNEHSNHFMGEAANLIQPIDKDLSGYIEEMVMHHNITSPTVMQLLLEIYLTQTLFKDENIPSKLNKRFWPSRRDIKNHIGRCMMKIRNTNIDQAVVEQLVAKWRKENPSDNFFLRTKKIEEATIELKCADDLEEMGEVDFIIGDNYNQENADHSDNFLYVHQTESQKRLLELYGNEICLMDATYRTTRYALPLYFICVPTNVNYITVASFIPETESTVSLIEALNILKSWNPKWKPEFFMCDYAEEEINALETVFSDSFVYLCDFHREQAWERWVSATNNGVLAQKHDVLKLLRPLANAKTVEDFEVARNDLQISKTWNENQKFQNWFSKQWLNKHERWVHASRQNRFNVNINTNNGIERQNRSLKYEFLMSRKASSLSHLLQVIVESFIPDTYKKYLTLNVKASEQARSYAPDIPAFLVNRPPDMVRHCFKRWEEAQYIEASDIDTVCDQTGTFIVKSQGSKDSTLNYLVKFEGDELGLPACDCEDWKKNHLVCKHFMAVFTHMKGWIWEKLPETYKSSPFLNLDIPFGNNFNSCAAVSVEVQNDGDDIDAENNEYLTELPLPSATRIKKTRQEFLSLCTEMKDLSYKTKDIDILRSVVEDANSILIKLKLNIPQTKEFILEEGGMTKTKITNKAKKKKVHIPFKRSRTKQKGSGRVGITASKVKECFTKKGVHELATEEKRPQLNIVEELNIADDFGQTIVIDEKDNSKIDNEDFCIYTHRKEVTVQKKRELINTTTDDTGISSKKKMKLNLKKTMPPKIITKKNAKAKQGSEGKPDDKDPCKEKILVKLEGYLKILTPRNWEDLAAKDNYVKGTAAKRAAVALDSAVEDAHVLISVVKTYVPSHMKISDHCLVELLFTIIARMVDEGILILEKDPLKTSETLEKEMQELIKFLKESGTLVSKARKIQWMDGYLTDLTVTEIDKQKVENKVAKIWQENVANKYFIAKIFGIDITYGDINSLKDSNWLTDKVMDAYLTYIAQTEMDKGNIKVRHQLVSTTNNIINGKYVPGRHEKNKLIPYDFVIGAYHQRGGHWDLLIVEPSKGKVVFLNPLGASPYQKRTVLLNWRKYIGQMMLLHPENGYKNWTLEVPDHSKQLDGSSCGIFCLLFAEKYLAGQSLLGITREEVNNKRVTIAHTLMMFEGHMVGCCPCCGFRTNADEEQLIQCKICKNLFHRKTHCVGEVFAVGTSNKDFVCEIDRQNSLIK